MNATKANNPQILTLVRTPEPPVRVPDLRGVNPGRRRGRRVLGQHPAPALGGGHQTLLVEPKRQPPGVPAV